MFNLVIREQEYKVPKEIKLKKWMEVTRHDIKLELNHPRIIHMLMDIPYDDIKDIPKGTKIMLMSFIANLLYPVVSIPNKKIRGKELINFDNLTLGQFIDLEMCIANKLHTSVIDFVTILYGSNTPDKKWTIQEVWGSITFYLKYRENIFNSYKNLFGIDNNIEPEELELTEKVKQDVSKTWYDIILTLADGKFLNIDQVTERPLIEALNWLAWNKEKMEEKINNLKKQKRML